MILVQLFLITFVLSMSHVKDIYYTNYISPTIRISYNCSAVQSNSVFDAMGYIGDYLVGTGFIPVLSNENFRVDCFSNCTISNTIINNNVSITTLCFDSNAFLPNTLYGTNSYSYSIVKGLLMAFGFRSDNDTTDIFDISQKDTSSIMDINNNSTNIYDLFSDTDKQVFSKVYTYHPFPPKSSSSSTSNINTCFNILFLYWVIQF